MGYAPQEDQNHNQRQQRGDVGVVIYFLLKRSASVEFQPTYDEEGARDDKRLYVVDAERYRSDGVLEGNYAEQQTKDSNDFFFHNYSLLTNAENPDTLVLPELLS
jgi:hypothetical protein